MELKVDIKDLQKCRLFVATPMYGGKCDGPYAKSVMDLAVFCSQHGIEMRTYFLFNESLITRARNYCVDEFLRSKTRYRDEKGNIVEGDYYTHMMFIDADISFDPRDVVAMMAMMTDESPYDVMCGPYPKKCISWEKIKLAVDKGIADDDPNELENYVGDYVFNPVQGGSIRLDEPAEISEGGTGFMMIRRNTFLKYAEAYPELSYKPDHVRTEHFDGSREITAFFDCIIAPDSKRYLSEDYMFCHNVRKAGMKVWLCPWMRLQHAGFYVFGGSLPHIAHLGASPTADPSLIKKKGK